MTGFINHIIGTYSRLRGWSTVQIGGRVYRCDPDNYWFWSKLNRGEWEPQTLRILENQLDSGSVYCDIGAWIGPTVLPAASLCSRVYCFEPDRVAYRYLLHNIQRNRLDNVLPFNFALCAQDRLDRLASPRGKSGDSMTSLLNPDGKNAQDVLCMRWQTWLEFMNNPDIDFIKIDIEGGEYGLLPEMSTYLRDNKPHLYLSLHPHLFETQEHQQKMSEIVGIVSCYRHVIDDTGTKQPIATLLKETYIHQAGSYLFIP